MNNTILKLKAEGFKAIEDNNPELLLDIVKKIKLISKYKRTISHVQYSNCDNNEST